MKKMFILTFLVTIFIFVTSISGLSGTITYTYDDAGRLIKVDYGDGKSISYTYDNNGNLLERETKGVNNPPTISSFSANSTSGHAPLSVTFTCNASDSDGSIASYKWDFNGDGNVDKETTENTTTYTYQNTGTYKAKVTVVDNEGAQTTSNELTITVTSVGPTISVTPTSIDFGSVLIKEYSKTKQITIKNVGEADLEVTNIYLSGKDKDDFSLSDTDNCSTIEPGKSCTFSVTFSPKEEGEKNASVEINSNDENHPTTTVSLKGKGVLSSSPIIDSFEADKTVGEAPLKVTFTCNAQDPDGTISEYEWDYGDGSDTEKTKDGKIEKTYDKAGIYKAKVTVSDDDGNKTSKELVIVVYPKGGSGTTTKDPTNNDATFALTVDNGNIKSLKIESPSDKEIGDPSDKKGTPKKIIEFSIGDVTTDTIKVTMGPTSIDNKTILYKFVGDTWTNLSENSTEFGLNVDKERGIFSFQIIDNGKLDADDNIGSVSDPFVIAEKKSSGGGGEAGCFIATAAYGTPMAKEVRYLCAFRDKYLLKNKVGKKFVELYYRYSPTIAKYIRDKERLKAFIRVSLKPFVWLSKELVGEFRGKKDKR